MTGPFAALGLPASPNLTDDDVRAAWRRVAAATHPDLPDGGDPDAFATAAAAYAVLRTPAGRGEALADLTAPVLQRSGLLSRVRRGRPGRLAARLLATAAAATIAVVTVGWQPAAFGVIAGSVTWLVVTGRGDIGPRRARTTGAG